MVQNLPRPELLQLQQWPLDFYRQMTNSKVHQQPLAWINIRKLKQCWSECNIFQDTRSQVKRRSIKGIPFMNQWSHKLKQLGKYKWIDLWSQFLQAMPLFFNHIVIQVIVCEVHTEVTTFKVNIKFKWVYRSKLNQECWEI